MTLTIDAKDLRLRYGDVTALDGLSFTLEPNRIHGLLGRNGSGKSSLLAVLAAFRKATSGEVRMGGQPVWENPAVTSRICLIRETGDVQEDEKVAETLRYAAYLRPTWDAAYARRLLDLFEVPADKKVNELSRGMRSAVGIAIGLASRAPITMLDESYLGLDAPSRYAFYDELLADYMAHPRTFILSTHLIEEVSRLFEEVLIIDKGKMLLQSPTDGLLSRGAGVTGPADAVDQFISGLTVINSRRLGPTKSAMVYGEMDDAHRARARSLGLEVEPIALQDLFVHLTETQKDAA